MCILITLNVADNRVFGGLNTLSCMQSCHDLELMVIIFLRLFRYPHLHIHEIKLSAHCDVMRGHTTTIFTVK